MLRTLLNFAFYLKTRILRHILYGEYSSVGRAPDCGSGGHGFKSHYSPQLYEDFMIPNIFWGITLIAVGSSMILNKLYGVYIPFELIAGSILVFLGVSVILSAKR